MLHVQSQTISRCVMPNQITRERQTPPSHTKSLRGQHPPSSTCPGTVCVSGRNMLRACKHSKHHRRLWASDHAIGNHCHSCLQKLHHVAAITAAECLQAGRLARPEKPGSQRERGFALLHTTSKQVLSNPVEMHANSNRCRQCACNAAKPRSHVCLRIVPLLTL